MCASEENLSTGIQDPSNPTDAWACLLTNVLVLPGLGSLLAGRRSGFLQALMALAGFVLTCTWVVWFTITWIRLAEFPWDLGPYLWTAMLGVLLFALGWCWGLLSGLSILREARRSRPHAKGSIP